MKHIIGFSGGLASAVVAKIIADTHGRENTVLLFHDTKTEPRDNDRFRAEVAAYIGLPITEDSDGRDIWQVFDDEGYLGNGRNTMCSRILKQERSVNYLLANHTPNLFRETEPAMLYIGFTPDEWQRAQRVTARYAQHGFEVRFPLMEQNISKAECRQRVEKCWGIRPPAMYAWADHANCVPCIKGKGAYWGLVYDNARWAWEKAARAEEKFGKTIFTEGPDESEDPTLRNLLPWCLDLAEKYRRKQEGVTLYDYPCECAV
jgi:hypothetical protein